MTSRDVKAGDEPVPGSARKQDLLRQTLGYAAEHSLSDLSLRPLAKAIGSSPRVLLYLFGSKNGLIREVLAAGRREQLALLHEAITGAVGPREALERLWGWLTDPGRAGLRRLFFEAYTRSTQGGDETWQDFAVRSIDDWLTPFVGLLSAGRSGTRPAGDDLAEATLVLAVLRGLFLDLLATEDHNRVNAAWQRFLSTWYPAGPDPRRSA